MSKMRPLKFIRAKKYKRASGGTEIDQKSFQRFKILIS